MKKIKTTILLLLSAITVCCAQSKYSRFYYQRVSHFESLPISKQDIVFVGNSITNGAEWSELFNNSRIKNRGINGDTAKGVLDRLSAITKGNPRKIFLMIGVNDLIKGITPDSVASVTKQIIQEIKTNSPKTKIYLQSVLPANRDLSEKIQAQGGIKGLNDLLLQIAEEQNILYIDLFCHFKNKNNDGINSEYSNDGLHLMDKGYLLWKQIITPHVK